MKPAPKPLNEKERLAKLNSYEILDTDADEKFDQITRTLAKVCNTKIALVSLIDKDRQWFKSRHGLDATETPRDISFCGHAIMGDEIFVVEDAEQDERFCDNPLFSGEPHVRFYAGMPLVTPDNYRLGTLCVIDSESKKLTELQIEVLKTFARNVVELLEHKYKIKTLNNLNQQYKDVQTMVQAGGWELDVESGQINWSEQIYNIFKIPHGTSINRADELSRHGVNDGGALLRMINECIAIKKKLDEAFELYDSNDQKKWVRAICKPLIANNGSVEKVIGTIQDITEKMNRLKDAEKLAQENKKFKNWIENSAQGVWNIDLQGSTTFVNPSMAQLLGYEASEMLGRTFFDFMDDDDHQAATEKLAQHEASASDTHEWRMLKKDGGDVWLNISAVPMLDLNGMPIGVLAMCSNITNLKDRERKLEKANVQIKNLNDQMQTILEHAPIAYYESKSNKNRSMNYIGTYIEQISGYPASEFLGDEARSFSSIIHPDDTAHIDCSTASLATEKTGFEFKYRIKHADGSLRWILDRGYLNPSTDNLVGVILDITNQENLSRELNNFFGQALNYLCIATEDGFLKKINPTWLSLGYSEAELLSRPFTDYIHPEDLDSTLQVVQKFRN
jgi:PAS domain S-box-containing protein